MEHIQRPLGIFEKAYQEWLSQEATISESSEPEFYPCGLQVLFTVDEPEEGVSYCDGLYHYIRKGNVTRKIKINGEPWEPVIEKAYFYAVEPCPVKLQVARLNRVASVRGEYLTLDGRPMDLTTFEGESENQRHAFTQAVNYDGNHKLIIGGEVARGKTHLARGIYLRLLSETPLICWWTTARDLAEVFRRRENGTYDEKSKADDRITRLQESEVLFIDDLGTERQTESELFEEQFMGLIEKHSPGIVITTNLDSTKLAKRYKEKIFGRLMAGAKTLTMIGEDYRAKFYPALKGNRK